MFQLSINSLDGRDCVFLNLPDKCAGMLQLYFSAWEWNLEPELKNPRWRSTVGPKNCIHNFIQVVIVKVFFDCLISSHGFEGDQELPSQNMQQKCIFEIQQKGKETVLGLPLSDSSRNSWEMTAILPLLGKIYGHEENDELAPRWTCTNKPCKANPHLSLVSLICLISHSLQLLEV